MNCLTGFGAFDIRFQPMASFIPIDNIYFMKTIRRAAAVKETSPCIFPHAPFDILSQVFAVEFIDGLDYAFQQMTGWRIFQRLVDGNEFDAPVAEQLLVNNGISPVAGKTVQFPNKDNFKWGMFGFSQGYHFAKSGAAVVTSAFRFVNIFFGYSTIMFKRIIA